MDRSVLRNSDGTVRRSEEYPGGPVVVRPEPEGGIRIYGWKRWADGLRKMNKGMTNVKMVGRSKRCTKQRIA